MWGITTWPWPDPCHFHLLTRGVTGWLWQAWRGAAQTLCQERTCHKARSVVSKQPPAVSLFTATSNCREPPRSRPEVSLRQLASADWQTEVTQNKSGRQYFPEVKTWISGPHLQSRCTGRWYLSGDPGAQQQLRSNQLDPSQVKK